MDRLNTNPSLSIPPDLTDEQVKQCLEMVVETFGEGFGVVAHLPRNVGVSGDKGIWGETILITAQDQEALTALHNEPEKIATLSTELTNRFGPLSRVLIDIVAHGLDEEIIVPPGIDFVPNIPGE